MIHIIVTMLSVTSHTVQIGYRIQMIYEPVNLLIGIKICGICLFHPLHMAVKHILPAVYEIQSDHLLYRILNKIRISHIPEIIIFLYKILQTDPYGLFGILYKIRRPVIIYLYSSQPHLSLLHIYPAVRYYISKRPYISRILKLQLFKQDACCHIIPVRKA